MSVRFLCAGWFALCLCTINVFSAYAAIPADALLPESTKGFLSIPSVERLLSQFNQSQFGKLASDPLMKPFVEDVKRQLRQRGLKQLDQMGLTWEELEGLPSGELALAVIQTGPDEGAVAMVINVAGHETAAQVVLDKVASRMDRNGAKRLQRRAGDPITAYQLPNEPGRRLPPNAAYFIYKDFLVASDNIAVIEGILSAVANGRKDSLASVPAYQAIRARCRAGADGTEVVPDVSWYLEPFGYAEVVRAASGRERRKGADMLKAFKNQGFTAIQGVGGFVNFSTGKYELVHRTMVYAPPVAGRDANSVDKYTLAARMLRFPSSENLGPQDWVPPDVATYSTFNWDMKRAFSAAETLVDEMVGERGVYRDVLESLRDDPDGPQVNIEKDLVAHLGTRATILTDNQLPIGPKSERKVLAAEITDEAAVAATIRKLMEAEKDARQHDYEGFTIWEIVDTKSEVPTLQIETPGGSVRHSDSESPPAERERLLSTSAICIANGHLFMSSHLDLLKKVLVQPKQSSHLGHAADFQLIDNHVRTMCPGAASFRTFSRSEEEFRPTYELVRTGQMPQSETILGTLLNSVLGEGEEGVPRKQRIDGHELPEFEAVRKYFGPAGMSIASLDDGWFAVGFTLAREPQIADDSHTGIKAASVRN